MIKGNDTHIKLVIIYILIAAFILRIVVIAAVTLKYPEGYIFYDDTPG